MRTMPMFLSRWPLRRASLGMHMVLVMLAASVPLALMLAWQLGGELHSRQTRMNESLQRSASALAASVERELAATVELLDALSRSGGGRGGVQRALEALPVEPAWRKLGLQAASGGASPGARISGVVLQPGRAVTLIEWPFIADDGASLVLAATIDAAHWQALASAGGPPPGGFLSLFDREHRLIARSNMPGSVGQQLPREAVESMAGQAWGVHRSALLEGGHTYSAWQMLSLSGWGVGAGVPAAPLDAAQRRASLAALATITACLLLGVALATLVARRVTRPLGQLATHGTLLGSAPALREIAQLSDALTESKARDAMSRARLQRQADDFQALFAGTPIGLAFSSAGQVRHNAAMDALIGPATPTEGDVAPVHVFHDGRPLPRHEHPLQRAAVRGEPVGPLELELRYASGATRHVLARATPLLDEGGHARAAVAALTDITERKQAERDRAVLAASERRARQQAEAANRAKDEFLAMLGHELRNPLGAITSAVEVLQSERGNSELAAQARQIVARQTRHLARLMDDLFDVGRVVAGKVALQARPLDLAALVRHVCATQDLAGASRGHRLTLALESVWVHADATRLEQVVTNLLGNAFKHTPAGRDIAVQLRKDNARALLQVQDHGDGIAPALLPHVFDLFVQGEQPLDRRAGGLGLGLTLVRRLVQLHGGDVGVQSSAEGSTFSVWLPSMAPPPVAEETPSRIARPQRHVLVVEDNDDARAALCSLLEQDGHAVTVAADGAQGVALLLRERPQAAIVDIGLPGLSGYELALQSRRAGYAGRLLAVSGYGGEQVMRRTQRHGFDGHLVKPIDRDRLRDFLNEERVS